MARATITDPVRNFKFQVTINATGNLATQTNGLDKIGFAVMSGVSVQNEMVGYREGGMNTHPHKFVGQSDFAPITFSRGVFAGQDQLYKWQQFMHAWNQGSANTGSTSVAGGNNYRCDIIVKVFDHPVSAGSYSSPGAVDGVAPSPGNARLGIKLFDCWPGTYSLSDLNAADSGIMVQQLTVHHEGFVVAWDAASINNLASIGG
jgi:phage tail-like protein